MRVARDSGVNESFTVGTALSVIVNKGWDNFAVAVDSGRLDMSSVSTVGRQKKSSVMIHELSTKSMILRPSLKFSGVVSISSYPPRLFKRICISS